MTHLRHLSAKNSVRLEPVVVTISKARYDEIRATTTEFARSNDARKVTRG